MTYGRMPLFPPACGDREMLHVPLFDTGKCCSPREECQCVRICNPACPGEYADVELCVDECGNLSVCIKRPPKPCPPPRRRHRGGCDCAPWYR